jgi:phosphoribosylformylglycinamidine synthase
LRSAVQVGNPFMEKLLIEACLELADTDWIVGMQDLGAAGLTSSAVESASKGGSGIEIDTALVPRREQGMNPYEVMLSESQERMLVVVRKGCQDKVKALFDRWGLHSDIIGRVTDDGIARIKDSKKVVAAAPVDILTDPPLYRVACRKPPWLKKLQSFDLDTVPDLPSKQCQATLLKLLASPNIASKHSVYRQYDHQVQTNTVIPPGRDGAVLRIKDTRKAIALTADGNGRLCYLDPYHGGAMAVAEAARNLVCTGAKPLATTDCLNFGNPEKPDVYYQLKECIRGMAAACRHLNTPVISGNVSLYNEIKGKAIYPTPVVGMVGLIRDVERHCTGGFKDEGDHVFLLGGNGGDGLGGSEYLELVHGLVAGRPVIDLNVEKKAQQCCLSLIRSGSIKSAHDCSDGGLAVALAECCIWGEIGFKGGWKTRGRLDAALFGEGPSRFIVSAAPAKAAKLEKEATRRGVRLTKLGEVRGTRLIIEGLVNKRISDLKEIWQAPRRW